MSALDIKPGDILRVGPHYLACGALNLVSQLASMSPLLAAPAMAFTVIPRGHLSYEVIEAHRGVAGDVFILSGNGPRVVEMLNRAGATVLDLQRGTSVFPPFDSGSSDLIRATFSGKTLWAQGGALPMSGLGHRQAVQRAVLACSDAGDFVLSAFVGHGSVPSVAADCGRRVIGIDTSPDKIRWVISILRSRADFTVEKLSEQEVRS